MTTPTDKKSNRGPGLLPTLAVCAALVLVAALSLLLIFNTEPTPERETEVRETASLVDVIVPETGNFRPNIDVLGVVRPAQSLELRARVSGAVEMLSPPLKPGGFVRKGEKLLRLDDADYRNLLLQREGELQQALAELEIERGRQEIAERDYRALQKDLDPDNRALVLRQPQLRSAQARVKAAEAAANQARIDLERTVITAPFDAQVLTRAVDLGSQVTPADVLATLVGIDQYWVEVNVPLDMLRWLRFSTAASSQGSEAVVRHRSAWPAGASRRGYLDQLIGELEGATRMARALVVVEDPLGLQDGTNSQVGLIIGAFVEVRLQGRELDGVLRLPRDAVRQDQNLWLLRDGVLAIQAVDIVFQDASYAYVSRGLEPDDQVVTTNLATVKNGLKLRLRGDSKDDKGIEPEST